MVRVFLNVAGIVGLLKILSICLKIRRGGSHVMFFLLTLTVFQESKTRGFLGIAEELL